MIEFGSQRGATPERPRGILMGTKVVLLPGDGIGPAISVARHGQLSTQKLLSRGCRRRK